MSEGEQLERDKALKFAKKELKKLGKAGKAEIKRMEEEEKVYIDAAWRHLYSATLSVIFARVIASDLTRKVWFETPSQESRNKSI